MVARSNEELIKLRERMRHSTSHVMADVVTTVIHNSRLNALVDEATVVMRKTGQFEPLITGLGAKLDASGATAKLTGDPNAKAAELTVEQIEKLLAGAEELIKSGKATDKERTAIFMLGSY